MKTTWYLIHFTGRYREQGFFKPCYYWIIQLARYFSLLVNRWRFSVKKRFRGKQKPRIIQIKVEFYHGFLSCGKCEHSPAPLGAVIFTKFEIKWIIQRRDTMARASLPVLRLVRGSTFEGAIKTHPFGRWWLTEDSAAYSISLLDFYPRFHAIHSNPWNLDNASDWWLGFKKTRREMWRAYIFSRYTRDVHGRKSIRMEGK